MARLVVSQNERLMLHLLELDKHRDDAEVPMGVSQEGIAQKLQIQVHNASRALASLQVEGLVSDRLAHVRGAPKRRRAYFLTEKGRRAAQVVKLDLSRRMVVVEHAGKTQELPLEDALRKIAALTGTSPNFNEVVDMARAKDAIRSEDLAGAPPGRIVAPEFIERSHGRPKVGLFFGRETERKAFIEALSSPEISAVLLLGMAGIGKSTLASKLFDELAGKRSMFWYSFREWDTEGVFLNALAEFLSACGRHDLTSALKRGTGHPELFTPIVSDLQGLEGFLFLDDVQKPARELTPLSMLTEASRASKSAKVILISRSVPTFFSKTLPGNMALELQGLDRDSAWKMAQSLNATDTMRVVNESHGHPLLINLMARSGVSSAKGDVISFIEREVYSALPNEERAGLEMLSVFRHPVPANAVTAPGYDTVARLKQRALVEEQEDGVATHDLIRSFFLDHLGSDRKSSLHLRAAAFCEANPGVEWKLETLYHYAEAGDWPNARNVALANAVELGREFPEETLALLVRIPAKDVNPREQAELLFLRGQLKDTMGDQEHALADFEECLALLGSEDSERRALVLESVAKLQSQIERLSESLIAHEKALRLYEKSRDREAQSREWMNIGGVYRKKGDFGKARQAYSKALSLATMDENRPAQAACVNNLALLDWDEGKLMDAELRLKEAVRLARAVKDHLGEARGLENLAELLRVQVRLSEMTNLLLESSEAFRRAGELVEFKRLQAACAESLGEQGRYGEGIAMCQKALERPELRRRPGLFQRSPRFDNGDLALSSALVDLLRGSGDFKGAAKEIARYAEMASAIDDPSLIAKGSLLRSLVFEDSGDLESAARALEEAEGVLRSAGNSEGLVAVHMRRGIIEEKKGDDAAAAKHYAEAARHAELISNSRAYSLAMENLRLVKENLSYSSPSTCSTSS